MDRRKWNVLFFLCIFSGVLSPALSCNPGWTEGMGKCFQVSSLHRADVRMARRYCMVFGGDLAYINTTFAVHLLGFLPHIDFSQNTYWLKENSVNADIFSTTAAPMSNLCVYLGFNGLDYGDCEDKRRFICEIRKHETDLSCPENWHLFGSTCYKMMPMLGDYNQSVGYCSGENGRLAILDNIDKEHHSAAVIIGQNKSFVVDARRVENGTFKWADGKDFQPSCVDCIQHSSGDCLGFQSDSEHPMIFTWVQLNCSDRNSFLCEMDAFATTTTATTTIATTTPATATSLATTIATTTLVPLQCPIGYNWKAHEESGFCYWETTYEADRLNWHQARQFCQAYGGDLATYQNLQQEIHGLGGARGHYRGLWFGLERSPNDLFHWVDGTPLNYTNWQYPGPNLLSRSKFCAMHGPNNGQWALDYCGVRRWFICKSPMVRSPTLPNLDLFKKTPCNISSASLYRHEWYLYKDHCYLVHEDAKYSWSMARNFCNDNGAHLASVHSFAETDFILLLSSITSNTDYWIGLSSNGIGYARTWSDKTPVDFLNWGDNLSPNEQNAMLSCVTFDKQRGFWNTAHCNIFSGVVCKRAVNSSSEFSTTETPLLPGNCDKGWYNLGNQCYKTFGEKWSQRQKWKDAKESCESVGASLASIHNEEQQDFITDLLLSVGNDAWIGLQNLNRGRAFEWSDDTPLDYTNWNANEPEWEPDDEDGPQIIQRNSCIKLSYEIEAMGKWNDIACSYKTAYICQKPKNPNITEPSEDPFVCSNITGWSKLGSSCYGFFDKIGSWIEAQKTCRSYNANLVSFKSSAMSIFLKKRMSTKYQFFWTGIREMSERKYGYLNGRRIKYTNWLPGQPRTVSTLMDNCVAMNANTAWVVRSCKENFSFVCEWNPDDDIMETVVEKRHTCPNASEWEDIGGDTCYIFSLSYKLTWNEAMMYCFRQGGFLTSIHSSEEANLIHQHLLKNTETSFLHIGLGLRNDGSFGWVDQSPLDFVQWDEDQPQTSHVRCVQLFIRNGKWRTVNCDELQKGFICSSTRDTKRDYLAIEDSTEDVIGNKLAIGGIFGIVICVLVVLAVTGVAAYYMCPSTRMRVSLLEHE